MISVIGSELVNSNKKVNIIYGFNGVGKTRLSREVSRLIGNDIIYYNAFTEDLFYWLDDTTFCIRENIFTRLILEEEGQDGNVIKLFQQYCDSKLTPVFNAEFSEVKFKYASGSDLEGEFVKISRGQESNFVWCIFEVLLELITNDEVSDKLSKYKYVFIDDPVSSLDENHLINMGINISNLINKCENKIKFIITTHNPLFFNVICNSMKKASKFIMKILEDGTSYLDEQKSDSPFAAHLDLLEQINFALLIDNGVRKYHFMFIRNILEKTANFLGYRSWSDLLPSDGQENTNAYVRTINILSHSSYSTYEVIDVTEDQARQLRYIVNHIYSNFKFKREGGGEDAQEK